MIVNRRECGEVCVECGTLVGLVGAVFGLELAEGTHPSRLEVVTTPTTEVQEAPT